MASIRLLLREKTRNEAPDSDEVCRRIGISTRRYAQIAGASTTVSLDSPCTPDSDVSLYEVIADDQSRPPDEVVGRRLDSHRLDELLESLCSQSQYDEALRFLQSLSDTRADEDGLRRRKATGKVVVRID